eukprot:90318-Chlamydomonas_euryale.AAC.6
MEAHRGPSQEARHKLLHTITTHHAHRNWQLRFRHVRRSTRLRKCGQITAEGMMLGVGVPAGGHVLVNLDTLH